MISWRAFSNNYWYENPTLKYFFQQLTVQQVSRIIRLVTCWSDSCCKPSQPKKCVRPTTNLSYWPKEYHRGLQCESWIVWIGSRDSKSRLTYTPSSLWATRHVCTIYMSDIILWSHAYVTVICYIRLRCVVLHAIFESVHLCAYDIPWRYFSGLSHIQILFSMISGLLSCII